MIEYALPDFNVHLKLNLMVHDMMHTAPELFFDDVRIASLYGNFPGCIMNGGRIMDGVPYTYDKISETFDRIGEAGLITRLTLTNMFIRPEQFEDEYCSAILKAAAGRNVEVIVYSDELGDYISDKYHFRRILSTTRALNGAGQLNEMLRRYDLVVLDYNRNKDNAFLRQVTDPARLEVMPNEQCEPGCPYRQEHYEHESRCQLENRNDFYPCRSSYEKGGFTSRTHTSPTLLSNEDIRRLNETYGIHWFKIVGRRNSPELILESYLYYLVRPEYRNTMNRILRSHLD